MKLIDTEHFAVQEIIYSQTAKKHNIDNTPKDEDVIDNLMSNVLSSWTPYGPNNTDKN